MSLSKKPYIFMKFRKLEYETEKAYLLIDKDYKEVWMSKTICKIQQISAKGVTALIAPFKYEEMTGNEIQLLDTEIKWRKPIVYEPEIKIKEQEGYKLLNAQMDACKFILNKRKSALFAETRTGKTIISLTAIKSRQDANIIDNVIIICPVRLTNQWERYCKIFNIKNFSIYGIQHFSNESLRETKSNELENIITEKTQIIIDESHMFKNPRAIRTPIFIKAINADCYKIIMTGTPIGKHMGDLYSQFEILDKKILNYSSYSEFERMHLLYGGTDGKKVVGYVNIEEFAYSLEPYIFRLKRNDVLKDRKITYTKKAFYLDEEEREEYNKKLKELKQLKEKGKDFAVLGAIVKLQQIVSASQNRIECLKSIINCRPIIFYKFDKEAELIKKEFDYPILNGKTKKKDFDKIIEDYNNYQIDGIIINQSLATGFDLGIAEQIIFYSSLFDVISKNQATDRAMSMFNDTVLDCIEIYCKNSIDEQILKVIERKENIKTAFYKEIQRLKEEEK